MRSFLTSTALLAAAGLATGGVLLGGTQPTRAASSFPAHYAARISR